VSARLKALESAHIRLQLWLTLHESLDELNHEHYVAQRENRRDLMHDLNPVLNDMYYEILHPEYPHEDPSEDLSALREAIRALQQRCQARASEIDHECARTNLSTPEAQASARRTTQLVDETRVDMFKTMDKHPRATERHRRASQVTFDEHDAKLVKINKKYDALIKILETRLDELCAENKATQKEYLQNIGSLASETQQEFKNVLDENQKHAFSQFQAKLDSHIEAIERVKNPKDLQAILGACSQDLATLTHPLKAGNKMPLGVERLEQAQKLLGALAHEKAILAQPLINDNGTSNLLSGAKGFQKEYLQDKQPSTSVLGELLHTEDIGNINAANSMKFGDSPPHRITLQEETKNTLRTMREPESTDEILVLMKNIQEKFEEAKLDDDDPISAPEEEIQAIEKLIEGLQANAREGSSLDKADLEMLQEKIDELQITYSENNALPDISQNLTKLIPQNQNRSMT
jgi:hypothetical protein